MGQSYQSQQMDGFIDCPLSRGKEQLKSQFIFWLIFAQRLHPPCQISPRGIDFFQRSKSPKNLLPSDPSWLVV